MAHLGTVQFEQHEIEGAFRFHDESALDGVSAHGYLNHSLWALVCDHRNVAPEVGIIRESAIRARLAGPIEVETYGVLQPDEEALVMDALAAAIEDGAVHRPTSEGAFPGDWELPAAVADEVTWSDGDTAFELTVPVPGDEDGWGPFRVRVELEGHTAHYFAVFDGGGMASDAPEAGFAVWDATRLIVAGRCPDMDDEGFLAFVMSLDQSGLGPRERRRWRAALAAAILMRGLPIGSDPFSQSGFRSASRARDG